MPSGWRDDVYYDPMYDPIREWLRLVISAAMLVAAFIAAYPIKIAASCYMEQSKGEVLDLALCRGFQQLELSVSALVGAALVEVVSILVLLYACRHEFLGVKRAYNRPFELPCFRRYHRESTTVSPMVTQS